MAWDFVLKGGGIFILILAVNVPPVFCCVPCSQISHSDCDHIHEYSFLDVDVLDQGHCHLVCQGLEPRCKFSIFDHSAFAEGNCKLYDESFSNTLLHCDVIVGPKEEVPGCDIAHPEDNTCQIYRKGNCKIYSTPEETFYVHTPELCQQHCKATTQCQMWQFFKEEQICHLMYSSLKSCAWEFFPRTPELAACGGECPVTTPSPPQTTSDPKKTTSAPPSPCITVGGQPCVFPFSAMGSVYNGCTHAGGYPVPWCATAVNEDGQVTEYGDCPVDDPNCPIDDHRKDWEEVFNA